MGQRKSDHRESASDRWPALLAAGQAGDARAYRQFLEEVSGFLRCIVQRTGTRPHAIDDVLQESLITVNAIRHTYDSRRPIKPWLAAIARRRAADWHRRNRTAAVNEVALDPEIVALSPDPAAGSAVAKIEARTTIENWLATVSPTQRRAIELVKLREMSLKQASLASGQSPGALKVAIHRGIQSMRERFGGVAA